MNRSATSSIRLNADDKKLIAALKKKTGLTTSVDVLRMGLRALAVKEGVKF